MENVGSKIYKLRIEKGVSQEKLAEQLDVARQTVSKWERDIAQPTAENIKNLCEFFGITSTYFFDDGEEIVVGKEEPTEQSAVTETVKNKSKVKTVKIIFIVIGLVLLVLCIIACGIAAYVSSISEMGGAWSDSSYSFDYKGIIFLSIGAIVVAIFITLLVLFIRNCIKNRNNK